MTSQQRSSRWFSLASFSRSAQPTPQRPPIRTTNPQQPITQTEVVQLRPPASQFIPSPRQTSSKPTVHTTLPGPTGSTLMAESAPRSLTSKTPTSTPPLRSPVAPEVPLPTTPASRSPPTANITSKPASVARPTLPLAPQPISMPTTNVTSKPIGPLAPQPISPAALVPNATSEPLIPARPLFPANLVPRSPSALTPPTTPATRYPAALQTQTINKSNTISPTTKTWVPLQTSSNKPTSRTPSATPPVASLSRSPSPSAPSPTALQTSAFINHAHNQVSFSKTINNSTKNTETHPPSPEKLKLIPRNSSDSKMEKTIKYTDQNGKYGMRIITLAGENKGAIMELSSSGKKGNSNGWRINYAKDNEEERSNIKDINGKSQPTMVVINNNVQGVNNSIVCNGHITDSDPCVHLSYSK